MVKRFHKLELGSTKVFFALFIIGIIVGALYANLFRDVYLNHVEFLDSYYMSKLNLLEIDYKVLFQYVFVHAYKNFIFFWLFSITILGIPYMICALLYFGFTTGFIVSVAVLKFGGKGLLLYLSYIMPHYVIYIPVAFLSLFVGFHLCREMAASQNGKNKVKIVMERMPVVIGLAILLLIGCFLETYINSALIKKVILLF